MGAASSATGCVLVTGASRGIGAAVAVALARAGYDVGCLSRTGRAPDVGAVIDDLPAQAAVELQVTLTAQLHCVACDVAEARQVRDAVAAVAQAAAARGRSIVGIVNNAGVHTSAPSHELTAEDFRSVMDVNALSVLNGAQAAYPYLLQAGGGLIVNIGSFFDKLGVKQNLAYCASKAAVGAITRCLAVEWASREIQVLNVAPGYIATDLNRDALQAGPLAEHLKKRIPRGRAGSANEVGRMVAALFTMGSPFMTGETLYIDGAQGIAAG
jgi:NAD(P)-dependent dehydrogenase (short-subunit alcohol dehydrogenase family)